MPKPNYQEAHRALRVARGRAVEHDCVDCGGSAKEWSFNFPEGSVPLIGTSGRAKAAPYSLNFDHYEPRCRPCHREFDKAEGKIFNNKVPHPGAQGKNHYKAKLSALTENDVITIRVLLRTKSERTVAAQYGVSRSVIQHIKNRLGIWAHVEEIF